MGLVDYIFNKNRETDWMLDVDIRDVSANRAYLKTMAKDTVLNFVARTMSTLKIEFKNKNNADDWDYILNVKPNSDMSAAIFWEKFFYRLLDDNAVLVIVTDDNQLLIADNYYRREYAVYEDTFSMVTIKNYTFEKTFKMSEVIFLEYNNDQLDTFMKGLFDDYSELFGRILEVAMRNNQIRATVGMEGTGTISDKKSEDGESKTKKLQRYMDKVFASFTTKSVAIVPQLKGFTYEEYTNKQGVSNQSLDELNKMITSLIDIVANAVGVPTALIYGEKSELDSNIKAMRKTCTAPLVKKIQDELIVKVLSRREYMNGERIRVINVLPVDIIENATQIDKIVSSGAFYVDEVRDNLEFEQLPNGEGQKIIMTKNYQEQTKGGEENK